MEYEIGDEPQGLPDEHDGDREGGLRSAFPLFSQPYNERGRPDKTDTALRQMGEAA